MKAHVELQEWWKRTEAGITSQTISMDRISGLESRYKIRLSDDFRDYLLFASPAGETFDHQNTTWWDFDRIKNIPEEFDSELEPAIHVRRDKYLFFADYCIWCWAWAISCADDETHGKVALIGGRGYDKFVADSFSDFVRRYISDIHSVS